MDQRGRKIWLIANALALLAACDDSKPKGVVYTLYRNSPTVGTILGEDARIHVATFDAAEDKDYNRDNCEKARDLFASHGVSRSDIGASVASSLNDNARDPCREQRQSVMRQSVLLAIVLSCLVVGGQGRTDFYDGKMLLQDCQGGDDQQETQNFAGLSQWGTCVGYIAAVVDAMSNAFLTAGSVNAKQLCVSEQVQLSQLKDIVRRWLSDHPEKRHLAASLLVFQALKEKFPCN